MTVTWIRAVAHYIGWLTEEGVAERQPTGEGTMSWHKGAIFTVDCIAVLAGALIAVPFVLILISPFLGSY